MKVIGILPCVDCVEKDTVRAFSYHAVTFCFAGIVVNILDVVMSVNQKLTDECMWIWEDLCPKKSKCTTLSEKTGLVTDSLPTSKVMNSLFCFSVDTFKILNCGVKKIT